MVDTQGNLKCVTNGRVKNVNISDRQYFKNAISGNGLSVGYFQHDRSIQAPSVNFAYPIIDESNQLKGVLVSVIALNWWNIALNETKLPKGANAIIADSNGLILADYPSTPSNLGKKITNKNFLHSEKKLTVFKDDKGVNKVFHRAVIYKDLHNNNLDIYITLSTGEFIDHANAKFIKTIFAFFSAIIVIALIGKRLISNSIFKPIAELALASDILAKGNMPTHSIKPNSPELYSLYNRFENMAATRLHAEANLKSKHDELTGLLNALPDTYIKLNIKGEILKISGIISPLLATDNIQPKNLFEILPKQISELILAKAAKLKNLLTLEFKVNTQQGEVYFEARINHLAKTAECIILLRDINQRKINDNALHLASLVYNNSRESMAITDPNGIIYDVNPAFCKTTQYSKEEVTGNTTHILSSDKHTKEFYQQIWGSINSTGRWQGEVINCKKMASY
ncbi:hypothetical protein P20652_1000 [Pseudoalteromonas sp. BSi20652]|nr:hypothetical protein P20652_1000 [Pseudoalteromonas sp. BSi20652]